MSGFDFHIDVEEYPDDEGFGAVIREAPTCTWFGDTAEQAVADAVVQLREAVGQAEPRLNDDGSYSLHLWMAPRRKSDEVLLGTFRGRHVVFGEPAAANNRHEEVVTVAQVSGGVRFGHFLFDDADEYRPRRHPGFEILARDLPKLAAALMQAYVDLTEEGGGMAPSAGRTR